MILELKRYSTTIESTLGLMFIDGRFECYTLEDKFQNIKIMRETRIPDGEYNIVKRNYGRIYESYKKYLWHKECHDMSSYLVGGGELKDWDNPFKRGYGRGRINEKMGKLADTSFRDWLQCYGKSGCSIEDSKGRRFWFDKKWLNE